MLKVRLTWLSAQVPTRLQESQAEGHPEQGARPLGAVLRSEEHALWVAKVRPHFPQVLDSLRQCPDGQAF